MIYKKNIKLDYLHTFVRSFNLTHGIWLLFLAFKGFSLFEIGIFETVFHITSIATEVPTGMIADVYGRKFTRILGILSYLVYLVILIYSTNFVVIVIGFIFCALGFTLESGSGEALVYDSLKLMNKEDTYMKVNGIKEVLYQIASGIAIIVGGYVAMISFNITFEITIAIYLVALLIIALMKETPIEASEEHISFKDKLYDQYIKTFKVVKNNKRLLLLTIISSVILAPITTIFFYMTNHLHSLGNSYFVIGIILALHSFFAAVGGFFAHKLEKKYKEKKILYFVPLFIAILFWLMVIDEISFIPFILIGFFDSMFYVVTLDYINKITPSDTRASVLSFFGLMFSIMMIITFPIIGLIGDLKGLQVGFIVLASIVTIFYLILLRVLSKNHLNSN